MYLTDSTPSSSYQVLAHFDGNLVVVPIVYNFQAQQAHIKQAYGQVKYEARGAASRQHFGGVLRELLETHLFPDDVQRDRERRIHI